MFTPNPGPLIFSLQDSGGLKITGSRIRIRNTVNGSLNPEINSCLQETNTLLQTLAKLTQDLPPLPEEAGYGYSYVDGYGYALFA
jgi:hypothetical protein